MIEVKAKGNYGGDYGYKVIVEDEGVYIKDGGQTVFIDIGDVEKVLEVIRQTYEEFKEFKKWQEKK